MSEWNGPMVHVRNTGTTVVVQVNTSAGVRGLLRFAYDVAALASARQ